MANTITTTIDAAGRLVIPKALREAAHLVGGEDVEIRLVGGVLEIESRPLALRVEEEGVLYVAQPASAKAPQLGQKEVQATRDSLRSSGR